MRSEFSNRKGAATFIDAIAMVAMVALSVFIVYLFITKSLPVIAGQLAVESAEIVGKDVASFTTLSAAAPDKIRIQYSPSAKFAYDLDAKDKIVTVKRLLNGAPTDVLEFFGYKLSTISTSETTAIDVEAHLSGVNYFVITKKVSGEKYVYDIEGN